MKLWTSPPSLPLPAIPRLARAALQVFGQSVEIWHGENALDQQLYCQDLHRVYELFLASRVLPTRGLCLDIGAGAGWFALPFAAAFPQWLVLCLEADAGRYQALCQTVQQSGLENILTVQAGFHPAAPPLSDPGPAAVDHSLNKGKKGFWDRKDLEQALQKILKPAQLERFCTLPGLGGRLAPQGLVGGGGTVQNCPVLAPDVVTALTPDLVKLDAPGVEPELAEALRPCDTGFVTGRLWHHVPSAKFAPADPHQPRQIYLPHGDLVLRRDYEAHLGGQRQGLDVVVAMYNARGFIRACLDSLLAADCPDIQVLVVDDGSTDGSGDLVAEHFGRHPRLRLLRKANGGCASARNHGRAASNASHIAFVDADDRVDPGLFPSLLELARYGGFNIVEGEFFTFETAESATGPGAVPVPEEGPAQEHRGAVVVEAEFAQGPQQRLGEIRYACGSSLALMQGQPSIWRRIYRRDFLDHWRIGFPEHVRAFDDQIFQLLCAQHGGEMAHVFGQAYHYRQHPGQDVKQADARHFYSFNMFREVLLRAEAEAWPDLQPVLGALIHTLRWSYAALPPALRELYREAAAGFLAMVAKAFGPALLERVQLERSGIDGLDFLLRQRLRQMADLPQGYGLLHMEDWRWQPEFIEMMAAIEPAALSG